MHTETRIEYYDIVPGLLTSCKQVSLNTYISLVLISKLHWYDAAQTKSGPVASELAAPSLGDTHSQCAFAHADCKKHATSTCRCGTCERTVFCVGHVLLVHFAMSQVLYGLSLFRECTVRHFGVDNVSSGKQCNPPNIHRTARKTECPDWESCVKPGPIYSKPLTICPPRADWDPSGMNASLKVASYRSASGRKRLSMLMERIGLVFRVSFGSALWTCSPECDKPETFEGSHAELGVGKQCVSAVAHATLFRFG